MLLQGWLPGGRTNNTFWRRFLVAGIIILVSLGIALAVPGKSSDIVTATGESPGSVGIPNITVPFRHGHAALLSR